MSEHDWSAFACPNPDCPTYGHKGQGNLRAHGWSSKQPPEGSGSLAH